MAATKDDGGARTDELVAEVRNLRPLRDLPVEEREKLGVRRGKGRPKDIALAPEPDPYLAQLGELRREHEQDDPLVSLGDDRQNGLHALDEAIHQLAREAAALGYDREEAERRGKDPSQICSRRCDALMRIASLVIQRHHRTDADLVEPHPKIVARLREMFFGFAVETVAEVADETTAEKFVQRLSAKMTPTT